MSLEFQNKELDNLKSITAPFLLESDDIPPFERIDAFSFEDLTYFTIKQEINQFGAWEGFDEIVLLGGIKDQGMDCALFIDNEFKGVIQCKHSEKKTRLGKTRFVKEFLKFLLYGIKDGKIQGEIQDFKYYILASGGVTGDTIYLINDFKNNIFKEPELEKWTNDIISQFSTLSSLKSYQNIRRELHLQLLNIQVRQLHEKDISMLLRQPYNLNILSHFFRVKKILAQPNTEESMNGRLALSYKKACQFLHSASFDFEQIPDQFGARQDTHIEREETDKLKSWILSDMPDKKKGIAILEANAGLGKSVVFKDLNKALEARNIPVLAIKADKYYAENRLELAKKLFQAETSFEAVLKALREKHQKIVILVDQLDALSQTLSTNRSFIATYNRLLNDLINYSEVRIIISVRTFDLNYDAELSHYLKPKYTRFSLGALQKKDVQRVLKQYGILKYSDKFLELVSIPNHLNIFCRLRGKALRNLDLLQNLNDLNKALWSDTEERASKQGLKVKQVLFKLAQRMYEQGRITLSSDYLEGYNMEVKFLKSNAILHQDLRGLQFFHQSFYDYVFSRYFIDQKKDLLTYIHEKGQSLYVRPTVKMLLEFLRDSRHEEYIRYVNTILKLKRYRFHLKVLVLNTVATTEVPSDQEKQCFLKTIHPRHQLLDVFMETSFSLPWMEFIFKQTIPERNLNYKLPKLLQLQNFLKQRLRITLAGSKNFDIKSFRRNIIFWFLVKNLSVHPQLIAKFLQDLPETIDQRNDFVQRVLIQVDHWEDEEWLPLFEHFFPFDKEAMKKAPHEANYWFFVILDRMAKYHPDFVIKKLRAVLIEYFHNELHLGTLNYTQKGIIEKLIEYYPIKCFEFLFEIMDEIIENGPKEWIKFLRQSEYYEGLHFRVSGYRKSIPDGDEELYVFLEKLFKTIARKDKLWFDSFYQKHKDTHSIAVLMLILNYLRDFPKKYLHQSFYLINIIHRKNGFLDYDDNFQYICRSLIGKIFGQLEVSDQRVLADMVMSVKHPAEYEVSHYKNDKSHHLKFAGKKEFLFIKAIPLAGLKKHDDLYRRYQELKRKFGEISDKAMDIGGTRTYGVGPPLKESAYIKMDFDHWLRSMQKFNDEYTRDSIDDPSKGGKDEHARKFEEVVKADSDRFYPLVELLFENKDISTVYLIAGLNGLVESNYDPKAILKIFKELIKRELHLVQVLRLIRMSRYLISEECIDTEVFSYLNELALNHEDPTRPYNPDNPLADSSQTVRSAATIAIMLCSYHRGWKEQIFKVVENSAKDPFESVRVGVLSQLAYLNQLDIYRAFEIFREITDTNDVQVLKNAMWSADYYLNRFFHEMRPFFDKIITYPGLHENGMVLVTKCWLFYEDSPATDELMERSLNAGDKALGAILHTVEENLFSEKPYNRKCQELLLQLLNFSSEELSRRFSGLILRKIKPEKFKVMESFLYAYVKSEHIEQEPRYFIQLLKEASKDHPESCLTLLEQCIDVKHHDIRKSGYLGQEPIQAVLSIFSAISKSDEIFKKNKDRVLDLFDTLLKDKQYRSRALVAIDTL